LGLGPVAVVSFIFAVLAELILFNTTITTVLHILQQHWPYFVDVNRRWQLLGVCLADRLRIPLRTTTQWVFVASAFFCFAGVIFVITAVSFATGLSLFYAAMSSSLSSFASLQVLPGPAPGLAYAAGALAIVSSVMLFCLAFLIHNTGKIAVNSNPLNVASGVAADRALPHSTSGLSLAPTRSGTFVSLNAPSTVCSPTNEIALT
jgi:hypothetical protein